MSEENQDRGDEHTGAGNDDLSAEERAAAAAAAEAAAAKIKTAEDAGAADADEKDVKIPKARFDEAVGKARKAQEAAEARAKELEDKLKAQEKGSDAEKIEKEISELEDKIDAALADGNKEKVAELRRQVRAKMQEVASANANQAAAYATAVAVERVRYDAAVERFEGLHPEMNPDSDKYDEALTADLIELKQAYEAAGLGSTDALKKAVKYVFKEAPKEVKQDEGDKGDKGDKGDDAAKAAAAEKAAKLKEEAIKRGLEARKAQPPAEGGKASDKAGKTTDNLNVLKMSDRDFAKLPEDEKARLRGDIL
jgi:hypothetical protein